MDFSEYLPIIDQFRHVWEPHFKDFSEQELMTFLDSDHTYKIIFENIQQQLSLNTTDLLTIFKSLINK